VDIALELCANIAMEINAINVTSLANNAYIGASALQYFSSNANGSAEIDYARWKETTPMVLTQTVQATSRTMTVTLIGGLQGSADPFCVDVLVNLIDSTVIE
jgi:uroporphyrinogen-III decarboxylase